jgi:SAM-dependent methyltransferase
VILRSPTSGRPLRTESAQVLTDGEERWPVLGGIPYLRTGREELVAAMLTALDRGDSTEAVLLALADQDDWWDGPVPEKEELLRAIGAPTLRTAMEHLGMGRVADYFAFRWSDPTFLSGLALLDAHAGGARSAFELGCGAGHLLRELRRRGVRVAGGDVVFSKLWLARQYVVGDADLVCFDAGSPFPMEDGAWDLALCHDALHYLPDIPHAVGELRRLAPTVLVGHAHNAAVGNHSAGAPLEPAGYAELLPGAAVYDDEALARALLDGAAPAAVGVQGLQDTPAIALASGGAPAGGAYALPRPGTRLRINPLLAGGSVHWPSERYRTEYEALSPHLTSPYEVPKGALAVGVSDEVDALARRRVLLDLPGRW